MNSFTPGLFSFSLAKYSHSTTANLEGKCLWIHIPGGDDLFIAFDMITRQDQTGLLVKKKLLKVIHRGEILEQVVLDDLIRQAGMDEEKATRSQISDVARVVIIIVKKPLIALRYQLPDGQIRRIQLNFLPASQYDTAISFLAELGLPIRDRNGQPQTTSTASQRSPSISQQPTHQEPASSSQNGSISQSNPVNIASGWIPNSNIRIHSSHGRLESTVAAGSICQGPHQPHGEPIRHPQFIQQDPLRRSLFTKDQRPATAPMLLSLASQDLLPPPRDLPFPAKAVPFLKPLLPRDRALAPLPDETNPGPTIEATEPALPTPAFTDEALVPGPKKHAPKKRPAPKTKAAPAKKRPQPKPKTAAAPESSSISAPAALAAPPAPTLLPETPLLSPKFTPPPMANRAEVDMLEWITAIDRFVAARPFAAPAPPPSQAVRDLEAYSARPEHERIAALNARILELLGQEQFITLCEDMEQAWARVGLGL